MWDENFGRICNHWHLEYLDTKHSQKTKKKLGSESLNPHKSIDRICNQWRRFDPKQRKETRKNKRIKNSANERKKKAVVPEAFNPSGKSMRRRIDGDRTKELIMLRGARGTKGEEWMWGGQEEEDWRWLWHCAAWVPDSKGVELFFIEINYAFLYCVC